MAEKATTLTPSVNKQISSKNCDFPSRGGLLTNRPPQSSHTTFAEALKKRPAFAGLDWLKGNFYVQWKSFLQIRDEFDHWQTKARDEGENKLFKFRGLDIEMCPTGIKVGEKGTMFFRWRFIVEGVVFMMMNSPTYANSPNMMFECSGDYCLTADEGAMSGYPRNSPAELSFSNISVRILLEIFLTEFFRGF